MHCIAQLMCLMVVFNKDVDNLEGEHLAELLLAHAGGDELLRGDLSIFILVHLSKSSGGDQFLGSLGDFFYFFFAQIFFLPLLGCHC